MAGQVNAQGAALDQVVMGPPGSNSGWSGLYTQGGVFCDKLVTEPPAPLTAPGRSLSQAAAERYADLVAMLFSLVMLLFGLFLLGTMSRFICDPFTSLGSPRNGVWCPVQALNDPCLCRMNETNVILFCFAVRRDIVGIVSLQGFQGNWELNQHLAEILNKKLDELTSSAGSQVRLCIEGMKKTPADLCL